jgi:hypothetical protein
MAKVLQYLLLGTFCLGLLTFVISYVRSNWRANAVGRYVMYFMITLTGVFFYLLFGELLGDYPGRIIVNIIFLLTINYGAWKLVWLLYRIRKDGEIKDDYIIR